MANSVKEQANETPACCCMDIGAVLDNSDCIATFEQTFDSQEQAEARLSELRAKVAEVASEPATDRSEITAIDNGFLMKASFEFANQAEALILQLANR